MNFFKDHNYIERFIHRNEQDNFTLYIDNIFSKTFPDHMPPNVEYDSVRDNYLAAVSFENYLNMGMLELYIRNHSASGALFSYINEFISNQDSKFYFKQNGIILLDYHLKIFDIRRFIITNGFIDDVFIKLVHKYFKSLEIITFINCTIGSSVNLSELKMKIELDKCIIHNLSSLNHICNNIEISEPIIKKYQSIIIHSKELELYMTDEQLKELLLYVTFPDATILFLHGSKFFQSLNYFGTAIPNLMTLWLEGYLFDFEFLYKTKNINHLYLMGIQEKYLYDKAKIFHYLKKVKYDRSNHVLEECLVEDELIKILNSLKHIHYSTYEKKLYLGEVKNHLLELMDIYKEGKYHLHYIYDGNNDNLYLESKFDGNRNDHIIFDHYTYEDYVKYKISDYLKLVQHVLQVQPIIYHPNGIPIVFKKEENMKKIHEDKVSIYQDECECYYQNCIHKSINRHEKKKVLRKDI